MKMNVENKLDKVVKILKEKGFVVYRKGGKEPGCGESPERLV